MKFFYDPGGWPVTAELNIFFIFNHLFHAWWRRTLGSQPSPWAGTWIDSQFLFWWKPWLYPQELLILLGGQGGMLLQQRNSTRHTFQLSLPWNHNYFYTEIGISHRLLLLLLSRFSRILANLGIDSWESTQSGSTTHSILVPVFRNIQTGKGNGDHGDRIMRSWQ